jgi:sugar/nucleoside kinase (ribokinase family)
VLPFPRTVRPLPETLASHSEFNRGAALDRVGGEDGFAARFFYGMIKGEPAEQAVKLGWDHGALIATFPWDTTIASLEQVRSLAKGGSPTSYVRIASPCDLKGSN